MAFLTPPHERSQAWKQVAAFDQPVCDVLPTNSDAQEIEIRLRRFADLHRRFARSRQWQQRAQYDDLTRLLRREEFLERSEQQCRTAVRHHLELGLVLVDLDDFGRINKRFDHMTGDVLLQLAAGALRSSLRVGDLAGRLGGDEFGVLLPHSGSAGIRQTMQRLLKAIREVEFESPLVPAGQSPLVRIHASLGGAILGSARAAPFEGLRRRAEGALRSAKTQGRGRVVLAEGDEGAR